MLFDDWSGIARVVVVGSLAYIALVLLLRVTGKRTLTKMNAFDLVVTVALGSTLASVILSKDIALVEGICALGLLIALQLCVTWLSVRSATVRRLVKAEPALLFHRGRMLHAALRAERVTAEEVHAAMRGAGVGNIDSVDAVILETDGSFSVLPRAEGNPPDALLDGVKKAPG